MHRLRGSVHHIEPYLGFGPTYPVCIREFWLRTSAATMHPGGQAGREREANVSEMQNRQNRDKLLPIQESPSILVVHLNRLSVIEQIRSRLDATLIFLVDGLDPV